MERARPWIAASAFCAAFLSGTWPRPSHAATTFELQQCLELVERNHPNLWANRAKLAQVHAQLDEVRWLPLSQIFIQGGMGVLPPIVGSATFTSSGANVLSTSLFSGFAPFFRVELQGTIPLYTFGKLSNATAAAEAAVRVQEWDFEKARQNARWDVRRAYFGLLFARDARYLVTEIVGYLDKAIAAMEKKLAAGDAKTSEAEKLRLEVLREEVGVRISEADKGESTALGALRFLTGVSSDFDVPDVPLTKPDRVIGALPQYMQAARLFRPEVNMAMAGIKARKSLLELQKARFLPDIGLGFFASYSYSQGATIQDNAWIGDPFNRFMFGALLGARWNLDILSNQARMSFAEGQLEEVKALEQFARTGVGAEVEGAYASVVEAREREERWERAERKAKRWLVTVNDAISVGGSEEKDLVDPLKAYANARAMHLLALHDLNRELSQLALVSGWDSAAPTGAQASSPTQ
jgi:outer membrane protein TolC